MKALEDVPRKTIDSSPQASPSKRKIVHVDDDEDDDGDNYEEEDAEGDSDDDKGYNTRYKGVKRVKVHGFSPERQEPKPKRKVGRPRKSAPEGDVVAVERRKRGRPRTTTSVGGEQIKVSKGKGKALENGDAAGEVVMTPSISKRPRGRPRKVVTTTTAESNGSPKKPLHSANNAPMSKDSGREVFDGIVLMKRNKNWKEGEAVGDDHGDEVLNDERCEEDAVLAAVNGDAQGDLSSLGGSNKGE